MRTVQKVTLTEAIIQEILTQIREGSLKPGDRLPSENQLMRQLGVSRPALREALKSLATMDVISIRPGHGATVNEIRDIGVLNPDILTLVLERGNELQQLHEARMVLEVALAGMAAERAEPEDWKRMEECLERLRSDDAVSKSEFPARDFHMAIAHAGHNPLLAQQMPAIYDTFYKLLQRRGRPLFSPEGEYEIHKELFDALKTRNPETAREAMRRHLEVSYARWFDEEG